MTTRTNRRMAEILFPHITKSPADYEAIYPPRTLPDGAKVTRIAPSPTGFVHFGNLYGALIDERLAHQSGGVFYLRVEDTDAKREVPGAVEAVLSALQAFGLRFDEGATADGDDGAYGPYRQRARVDLYQTIAKELVLRGFAYPCFCTEEDLQALRRQQEDLGQTPGYYGEFARHAEITPEQAAELLAQGKDYALRLRAPGKEGARVCYHDGIKGDLDLPENTQHIVLLKSDGIPTYHFAHVVDDHFMRTTHVVRGEDWLSTTPYHLQLFELLGWKRPEYLHTPNLLKLDGTSKRKLSKRKDPELRLSFYLEAGYPVPAVMEYLLTVLNSNFEEWRAKHKEDPLTDFPFRADKIGSAGALFDLDKLNDISKTVISRMSGEEVYTAVEAWACAYQPSFHEIFTRNPAYSQAVLSIGRGGAKPRKDLTTWSDVPEYCAFFFPETYVPSAEFPPHMPKQDVVSVLRKYQTLYDPQADQQTWFATVKELTASMGYAVDMKAYKADPSAYPGSVADISSVLRVAVTGRTSSPDTYQVMQVLGYACVQVRLAQAADSMEK